jgi:histidine triad (HIT) family protein
LANAGSTPIFDRKRNEHIGRKEAEKQNLTTALHSAATPKPNPAPRLEEGTLVLTDNLFLKIIEKKIPAKIAYEDDLCLAFHDINPQAPVHILLIPKKVIRTHADLTDADGEILGHLHLVAVNLARQLGLADGYRIVINCKEIAGQTVPHLHMHLLGGRSLLWPPG